MNNIRRKKINQAYKLLEQANDLLDEVKSEEYDSMDALPDNFRFGEAGEQMKAYIEMIDESIGCILDANSILEQI